jgi:fluoride exporter
MNTILVMLGGAIGAAARYHLGGLAARAFGSAFPWGTLLVNIAGGLLIGLLFARTPAEPARLLLGVGVLGGFTTFSAFGLETVQMFERGALAPAFSYVLASVVGALLATVAGLALGRAA